MTQRSSPRIVIIGAGVAGIAAATSLLDRGFENVTIIEAENRIGGRIFSVPFGTKNLDLGAHWVHGEGGNTVFEMVNKMGLLYHSGDFDSVYFISDDRRQIPVDVGMSLFASAGSVLQNDTQLLNFSGSLEDYLIPRSREIFKKEIHEEDMLEAFLDWLKKFECTVEGCDILGDPSAAGLTQYKQCDGDPIMSWNNGGYYNIIDILLRQHPKCVGPAISLNNRVVLNTEVVEIDWSGLTAFIKCSDGKMYKADHVIVTTSLGVLKEKFRSLFKPALPVEKIRAIVGLGIGTVNKIYIRFASSWWPRNCSGFSLLWTSKTPADKEVLPWEREIIGFYTESAIDPNVLGAWIVGQGARDMELSTDQEVKEACYRVLKKFLSHLYEIPEPVEILRSKWFSNKHFRGSYSFRSTNTEVLNTSSSILAEPLVNDYNKQMLMFAGEATHSHFYSTVHGALETGWREAKRIADLYTPEQLTKCSL